MSPAESVRPSNGDGVKDAVVVNHVNDGDVHVRGEIEESEDDDSSEHGAVKPRLLTAPNPPSRQEKM